MVKKDKKKIIKSIFFAIVLVSITLLSTGCIKENIYEEPLPETTETDGINWDHLIIQVFFPNDLNRKQVIMITESINGEIVEMNPVTNMYRIHVNATNMDELDKLCDTICSFTDVEAIFIERKSYIDIDN